MAKRRKPDEVAVQRDDLTGVLQRYRPHHGIGHQIANCLRLGTQLVQQSEVTRPESGEHVVRLCAGCLDKGKGLNTRRRHGKDAPIGGQSQKRAPHHSGDSKRLIPLQHPVEPRADGSVVVMIASLRGQDDVDVE